MKVMTAFPPPAPKRRWKTPQKSWRWFFVYSMLGLVLLVFFASLISFERYIKRSLSFDHDALASWTQGRGESKNLDCGGALQARQAFEKRYVWTDSYQGATIHGGFSHATPVALAYANTLGLLARGCVDRQQASSHIARLRARIAADVGGWRGLLLHVPIGHDGWRLVTGMDMLRAGTSFLRPAKVQFDLCMATAPGQITDAAGRVSYCRQTAPGTTLAAK